MMSSSKQSCDKRLGQGEDHSFLQENYATASFDKNVEPVNIATSSWMQDTEQIQDAYADNKDRSQELSGGQGEQGCDVEEQTNGAAHPGQQERTHDADEEYIQDLISSPERIRVRNLHALLFPCSCLIVIILQRVTKQLQKLKFSNPGPQMRSHATDS